MTFRFRPMKHHLILAIKGLLFCTEANLETLNKLLEHLQNMSTTIPNPDQPTIDGLTAQATAQNAKLELAKTSIAALIAAQTVNPTAPPDFTALKAQLGITDQEVADIAAELQPPAAPVAS